MNLALHLTDACDLSCAYCHRRGRRAGEMGLKTAEAAIALCERSGDGRHQLEFVGGEPLLCEELIRAVVARGRRSSASFGFSLITSGTRLTEDFLRFSRDTGVAISLSIDGTAAAHDRFRRRGSQGSWDSVSTSLDRLLAFQPEAPALMTVNPATLPDLVEGVETLAARGVRRFAISFNEAADWPVGDEDRLAELFRGLALLYLEGFREGRRLEINLFEDKIRWRVEEGLSRGRCELGPSQLAVAADGSLFPCVAFVGEAPFRLGHLKDGRPPRRKACPVPPRADGPDCPVCDVRDLCFNWCACARFLGGAGGGIPAFLCRRERVLVPIVQATARTLFEERNPLFMATFYGL